MDALQILEKVNSFYSNSFNQLIIITVTILGFGGIILPILLQLIQSRIYKAEQKSLQSLITSEIAKGLEELKKELTSSFDSEKKNIQELFNENKAKMEDDVKKEIQKANAGVFFVQGTTSVSSNKCSGAVRSFADSAKLYLKGEDERNALLAINNILKCIRLLDKSNYKDDESIEESIESLIKEMDVKDSTGRYTDTIIKVRNEFEKAKNKEVPSKTTT